MHKQCGTTQGCLFARQTSDYGSGKRHEITLEAYADYWRKHSEGLDPRILYLKDWHFVNEHSEYEVPWSPDRVDLIYIE